jgi:hypothetical protein
MPSVLMKYLSMSEERHVEMDLDITLDRNQEEDSTTVMEIITELAERLIPKKGGRMLEDLGFAMGELSRPKIYLCTIPCNTWLLIDTQRCQEEAEEHADIYVDAGTPLKRVYLVTLLSRKTYWIKGLPAVWIYPSFSITARIEKGRTADREFRIENGSQAEKVRELIDSILANASNTPKNRQRVVHVPRQV